ncbi:hypothetical protein AALO_G00002130 [Alosa alosa]|uniref:Uncharacterized protein n=1 Tax=Alosa alosa TaxID=278164 RepID=A0AAV6HD70_9TELE|nr:hypothetical protein AALO_G00002130 [Alosa alosa]
MRTVNIAISDCSSSLQHSLHSTSRKRHSYSLETGWLSQRKNKHHYPLCEGCSKIKPEDKACSVHTDRSGYNVTWSSHPE